MRKLLFLLTLCEIFEYSKADANDSSCHFPGSPKHGFLSGFAENFPNGSVAKFACSPGYDLLGPENLTCVSGKWDLGAPLCVRDVALGKPLKQTEPFGIDFKSELAVDGNDTTCTGAANHWSIDLLEYSTITILRLVFGSKVPANAVSIQIGEKTARSSEDPHMSMCSVIEREIQANEIYFVKCRSQPTFGSYIRVDVDPKHGFVPLCTVKAYASSGLSHEDACPQGNKDTIKDAFNGTCFEFHYIESVSISDARSICYNAGGYLIGGAYTDQRALDYLKWRGETIFLGSPFWLDLNLTEAAKLGNRTEASNDSSSGACYVLSSRSGFGRSECQSPNHVICAYNVVTCGRPHLPRAFHDWQVIGKLKTGRSLRNVGCSEGYYPEANEPPICEPSGEIRGNVECHKFKCGRQPSVKDAFSWAQSNSSVDYSCMRGKFVKGDSRVYCDEATSQWGVAPSCRTLIEVLNDWFNTVGDKAANGSHYVLERFQGISVISRIAILSAVAAVLALVILASLYRIWFSGKPKELRGALRLESRRDLIGIADSLSNCS
ncbi:uncharacterized protein LOC100904793 [Galendromus occidentalis]|uniref:Uncharacterized protein LOC100904793 n=1 Tax=Galendromus occidentalis TaxID=34638 RepID=A0AAJ6QQ48_9ACAR|nr:uncharacterized protein LOC100904793 [Galendromus occidentalis]